MKGGRGGGSAREVAWAQDFRNWAKVLSSGIRLLYIGLTYTY